MHTLSLPTVRYDGRIEVAVMWHEANQKPRQVAAGYGDTPGEAMRNARSAQATHMEAQRIHEAAAAKYRARVAALEAEGLSTSDAQACADAELRRE